MPYKHFTTILINVYLLANPLNSHSDNLGKTYDIVEPDTILEIKERSSRIDWEKKFKSIDIEKKYTEGIVKLPVSMENKTYTLDLTYSLNNDIRDNNGKTIYPAGYRFNPVKYIKLPYRFGILNDRPIEINWAKKQKGEILWMTASGNPIKLTNQIGSKVYLYTKDVDDRFNIGGTPALIEQVDDKLIAHEYALTEPGSVDLPK